MTLMLIGIVLRGSSLVFRKADRAGEHGPPGWRPIFALSSLIAPVMIGGVAGTITTPVPGYGDGVMTGGASDPGSRHSVGMGSVTRLAP